MLRGLILVGAGKMGGALLEGWQQASVADHIYVVDPSSPACLASVNDIPVGAVIDAVVFAVKPQVLADVVADYVGHIASGALCVSIAAGKTVSFFENQFGASARIVRSMPNLPASIGRGVTVACANAPVTAADRDMATRLLSAVGKVVWMDDEAMLDPVTALSGSGPAYVFLLIEVLAKAGMRAGLAPDVAETLARETVIGSAALAAESALAASTLRENVTSPGGTTAAALKVLMADPGLQDIFDRAIEAATARSRELAG